MKKITLSLICLLFSYSITFASENPFINILGYITWRAIGVAIIIGLFLIILIGIGILIKSKK